MMFVLVDNKPYLAEADGMRYPAYINNYGVAVDTQHGVAYKRADFRAYTAAEITAMLGSECGSFEPEVKPQPTATPVTTTAEGG